MYSLDLGRLLAGVSQSILVPVMHPTYNELLRLVRAKVERTKKKLTRDEFEWFGNSVRPGLCIVFTVRCHGSPGVNCGEVAGKHQFGCVAEN